MESVLILVAISVESDLNFAAVTAESLFNLSRIALVLSDNAEPIATPNKLILFDKLTVSRAIRLLSIVAVSDKFSFASNLPEVADAEPNPRATQPELSKVSSVAIIGVFNLYIESVD